MNGNFDDANGIRNLQDLFAALESQVDGDYIPAKKDFTTFAILHFRKYLKLEGRSGRKEFISATLLYIALFLFFSPFLLIPFINLIFGLVFGLIMLLCIPATITLTVRRFHDLNVTGWATALSFIPFLGFLVTFFLCIIPGTRGDNQHGADPRAAWSDDDTGKHLSKE